jgi:tetratricopeptide (TPR) repeat protein
MSDWKAHVEREVARYEDGEARLPGLTDSDDRQRQLTRMGNAAGGAGLALLMAGRNDEAATWFARAAERYRESFPEAPPGSWGRPIGAVKARLLAGNWDGAVADAEWALDVDARHAESPIGRYAASLALLVLDQDDEALVQAASIQGRDDFPKDVADALAALALRDVDLYASAVSSVLLSFETRDGYLEDIPVADTVMVLQALAARRGIAGGLSSPLLPA